jgi:Lon protease-like protein
VLFPGVAIPLHVFEPRYREMTSRVLEGDRSFGVVAIRAGTEVGARAEVHDVGCLATIEEIATFDDGRYAMIVRGTRRFRIDERLPDDPYPQGNVTLLDDGEGDGANALADKARRAFTKYRGVAGASESELPPDPVGCSYAIAAGLRVPLPEQQRLLELDTAADRLRQAAEIAAREASILAKFGPAVVRPNAPFSGN